MENFKKELAFLGGDGKVAKLTEGLEMAKPLRLTIYSNFPNESGVMLSEEEVRDLRIFLLENVEGMRK